MPEVCIWDLADSEAFLPESVQYTRDQFNDETYAQTMEASPVAARGVYNGTPYELLSEKPAPSEIVVYPSQFGEGIAHSTRFRGEFLRRVLKSSGVTDPQGDTPGILLVGAASWNSTFGLDRQARSQVAHGDLSPVSDRYSSITESLNASRIALLGGSQAGAIVLNMASRLGRNVDVVGITSIDPAGTFDRPPLPFAQAYIAENAHYRDAVSSLGPKSINDAEMFEDGSKGVILGLYGLSKYALGVVRHARQNAALFTALSKDTLSTDLPAAATRLYGAPLVMSWFAGSGISDAEAIKDASAGTMQGNPEANISLIEIQSAHHAHLNNPLVVASLGLQMYVKDVGAR